MSCGNSSRTLAKPRRIVGDCDASGEDIERDFVARTGCWSTGERVALTYEQVLAYGLPPAEGKRGDPRWPAFARRHHLDPARPVQWEVEALDPDELRRLVLAAVAPHVDRTVLARQIAREGEQRRALRRFARSWPDGSRFSGTRTEGAAADEPTVTSPVVHDPAAVERFWTAELMREAEPLPMPGYDEDDEASGPGWCRHRHLAAGPGPPCLVRLARGTKRADLGLAQGPEVATTCETTTLPGDGPGPGRSPLPAPCDAPSPCGAVVAASASWHRCR